MQQFRIGMGHDIHALVEGRELWLGGVKIPFELGLQGHSDADALIHAIMDAMLGALALGDIGQLFPDTDPAFKGIASLKLLEVVRAKVAEAGYRIGNLDCMIHCEVPKIAPHRAAIINTMAGALRLEQNQVSLKAGTNEGFDAIGKRQAIACHAIVLLVKD
ncbi:MAG TPA: 2-C-methyl-D-erythritol 2,4-cyclodiphosphate synthase [Candidatus Riflebacteria bacterium]|jgi:2-C-methyl-D-erythritol 2,4-cyclodiphosphate synthase|nr:2-C-methyl-D-erythritol 2,4-cyclodiphosphate synthase [Candidatus Riflebacteria bacterium]